MSLRGLHWLSKPTLSSSPLPLTLHVLIWLSTPNDGSTPRMLALHPCSWVALSMSKDVSPRFAQALQAHTDLSTYPVDSPCQMMSPRGFHWLCITTPCELVALPVLPWLSKHKDVSPPRMLTLHPCSWPSTSLVDSPCQMMSPRGFHWLFKSTLHLSR